MYTLYICLICFTLILALLSTLAFVGANRSVKELTSFEISFQQMAKALFFMPLFSKLAHKNNACASGMCLQGQLPVISQNTYSIYSPLTREEPRLITASGSLECFFFHPFVDDCWTALMFIIL